MTLSNIKYLLKQYLHAVLEITAFCAFYFKFWTLIFCAFPNKQTLCTRISQDCAVSGHLPSGLNREFLKYEYHIIYSNSYSVPVLYFTASKQGLYFMICTS